MTPRQFHEAIAERTESKFMIGLPAMKITVSNYDVLASRFMLEWLDENMKDCTHASIQRVLDLAKYHVIPGPQKTIFAESEEVINNLLEEIGTKTQEAQVLRWIINEMPAIRPTLGKINEVIDNIKWWLTFWAATPTEEDADAQ